MNEMFLSLLILALGTWFAAALGAGIVAFFKKDNLKMSRIIMGFAAGVILAVTFWELLEPAMHVAANPEIVVPVCFILGFAFIYFLDKLIRRLPDLKGEQDSPYAYRKSLVLGSALSLHNIPEGLALGIVLGVIAAGAAAAGSAEDLLYVLPMAIGVGLHKIPEGTVLAVSFRKEGLGKLKSFVFGQVTGFIGFLTGLIGFLLMSVTDAIIPYALAFAGGAMIWVAVHELIPESQGVGCRVHSCPGDDKKSHLGTVGVFLGVLAILLLHTVFSHDHHGHSHGHGHNDCGSATACDHHDCHDHHHHDHYDDHHYCHFDDDHCDDCSCDNGCSHDDCSHDDH
jgi:ZIP family zinc transporter